MSEVLEEFVWNYLRRRLRQADAAEHARELPRLVSFERQALPGAGDEPAGAVQTLARFELLFRRGDLTIELNAHDGAPMSWVFAKLAEGSTGPLAAAQALQVAEAAAAPPAGAVLAHAEYETIAGRPVFIARWEHHDDGVPVERDYIQVSISGDSGRVFSVHRHWHDVDLNPTER